MIKAYPKKLVFSFDLESSGLHAEVGQPYLLEFAFVPMDVNEGKVLQDQALHMYLKCPSIEKMKQEGKISEFVLNNDTLIRVAQKAHDTGVSIEEARRAIQKYLESFKNADKAEDTQAKATILAKSTGGLDRRLLGEVFGDYWIESLLSHQMIDITSNAFMIYHADLSIVDSKSPHKLVQQLLGKEELAHTALQDAVDMGKVYLEIIKRLKEQFNQ